jgi:GxxExxY protein
MELLEKELTGKIIEACIDISKELGPGFLESAYKKALIIVLTSMGIKAEEEVPLKVKFRSFIIGEFSADVLVEKRVIVELKAIKSLTSEHEAQLIHYLKATGIKVGLLINFGKAKVEWKRLVY